MANVPTNIQLPTTIPTQDPALAGFLSQLGIGLNGWVATASTAVNGLLAAPQLAIGPPGPQGPQGPPGSSNQAGPQGPPGTPGPTYSAGSGLNLAGTTFSLGTITLSGDVSGSGSTAIPVTLDTVNSNVGQFESVTVNGKGLVTAAVALSGYGTTSSGVLTVNKVQGTTAGGNATAGDVGEVISTGIGQGGALALTNNVSKDITSISLTAGDWDVEGLVSFLFGSSANYTLLQGWVNNTSVTPPAVATQGGIFGFSGSAQLPANATATLFPTGPSRFNVTTTTTIFLTCLALFSAGTVSGYGFIRARRMR